MRSVFCLACVLLLSGCSVQGMFVKGNSLDSYKGTASLPEVHQVADGYAVKGTLHNHTNLSHAALTPQELVDVAKSRGVAVLGIAEHDSLEACWSGMFCFRNPSVQRMGYAAYLEQLAGLQRQNPDVIVLPGVEVSPYAWWSGFPPFLTLHDWDVHFTVYNVERPEVLGDMPVLGDRYPRCCSYERPSGMTRYQDFVKYINDAGGAVFLAHPSNFSRRKFYVAKAETPPHPEYAQLEELTGFAALPVGQMKPVAPGGIWDTTLSEYLEGKRKKPVWVVGDSDFHGGNQKLDAVVTWFYTAALDKGSVLSSMAGGRMVAVQGGAGEAVYVKEFSLTHPDEAIPRVMCGETVRDQKATTIRFALSRPLTGLAVRVIRNGSVIYNGDKFHFTFDDSAFLSRGEPGFYRVEATGDGGFVMVTNPVFRLPR